jgi:hypothetical protein
MDDNSNDIVTLQAMLDLGQIFSQACLPDNIIGFECLPAFFVYVVDV